MLDTPTSISLIFTFLLKIGFLLLTTIFIGFAVLFIRQVKVMTEAVHDPLNPKLRIISWAYLILTAAIFIFFIFYL
ncbi:MAG: hypothetical protein GXP43_02120 [bacterium]|nr:hypothetical protein [bacterium]